MRGFTFWWGWLLVSSVLACGMGLLFALWPESPLWAPHTTAMTHAFFGERMPVEAQRMRAFLFGPVGGTIAGYFLLQTLVVWGPFRRREYWAWHAVCWPLLLWFTIDSTMSMYHGALFNVWMINIWTLVMVGIPLAMTRRAFASDRQ